MNIDEPYIHYSRYAQNIALAGFFLTTFLCSLLVYLTIFEITRNFGSYKNLLVTFASFGIFFASTEVVLKLNVYSHNAGWIFYAISRPFDLSTSFMNWLLPLYTGSYSLTTSMLSVQFVYRYCALFHESKLRFFGGWRFLICIFFALLFAIQWAMGMHYFLEFDDYSISYFRIEMLEKYNMDISEIAGVALVVYDADGSIRWWNVLCTLNMTFIMSVQYTIIIYCAVRMYLNMETKLQLLSSTLRIQHKQFYKTLILQVVTPTFTLFLPIMMVNNLPFLNLHFDFPSGIFTSGLVLYPALDACIVMYVVQDYRKAIRNVFKKSVDKIQFTVTWTQNTTTVNVQNAVLF